MMNVITDCRQTFQKVYTKNKISLPIAGKKCTTVLFKICAFPGCTQHPDQALGENHLFLEHLPLLITDETLADHRERFKLCFGSCQQRQAGLGLRRRVCIEIEIMTMQAPCTIGLCDFVDYSSKILTFIGQW